MRLYDLIEEKKLLVKRIVRLLFRNIVIEPENPKNIIKIYIF